MSDGFNEIHIIPICRAQGCGRPAMGGIGSLCRQCWDLLYESCEEDAKWEQSEPAGWEPEGDKEKDESE